MIWFKVCLFGVLLLASNRKGTANPFTREELAVAAEGIQRIGDSLHYTPSAINRVIAVMTQNSDKDEKVVLMLEGALYQTREQRLLSGDTRQYNVRKSLEKISETNSIDTTSWDGFDEDKLAILRQQIESEFPENVADIVVKLTREQSNKAKTPEQSTKFAIDWLILLLDGATAVTD